MRPLPRLLAFADDRIATLDDLGVRAAAIAAAGSAVALVARRPAGNTDALATLAGRFMSLAQPPMASVLVTGRADVARATAAQGVILRAADLGVADARTILGNAGWCLRTVHSESEAAVAADQGADAMVVGTIWPTPTHPDRAPTGLALLERVARRGVPVFAIGGVSPARAHEARNAGAWGVAAITAVWDTPDCYRAALALVAPWLEQ